MADEYQFNKEKLSEFLAKSDHLPTDLAQFKEKQAGPDVMAFKQESSVESTEREIEYIDTILSGEYDQEIWGNEKLSEEQLAEKEQMIEKLRHKKTLDTAHLLLNEHSYSDSAEMQAVKRDILSLCVFLEENSSKTVSAELMDNTEVMYSLATASCRKYLDNKNPTFKKGKIRKKMVRDLFMSLLVEVELFHIKRSAINPEENMTLGEMLGGNRTEEIKRPEVEKKPEQEKPVPAEVLETQRLFSEGYDIAAEIKACKDKRKMAAQYRQLLVTLKGFAPNRVEVLDVELMGKKVRIVQRSDNSLTIVNNGVELPLERNSKLLADKIECAIMGSSQAFGMEMVGELLKGYKETAPTSGEHKRIRTNLTTFLAGKTNLVENQFNNTFKEKMVEYVEALIAGTMTGEEIRKEVIEASEKNVFVNGVELSEMVKISKSNIDEIRRMVVLEQRENIEVIPPGWTKEEQDVKNLLADMIFTSNTEQMDESISDPRTFMQRILKQHSAAVLSLQKNEDLVNVVLEKMSIGDISGTVKGNEVKLAQVVTRAMTTLNRFIAGQMKRFEEGGDLTDKKDKKYEDKLELILNEESEATRSALINAKKELDTVVDETCEILQLNVTKMTESLFPESEKEEDFTNKSLQQMIDEATQSTKGMGKFMRNTLKTYFGSVSNMDKRAMLASLFRFAENVPEFVGTDEQLIDEIREQKIEEFKNCFNKKDRDGKVILSDEDKAALLKYREQKHTLNKQANFFGGLLRGAGPLLQKMMQAMDRAPLPPQILKAIADMKSNLLPIPDGVVQTQFMAMVESSGGKVTKIETVKSLGAASVGQTFLCRLYGPDMPKEGEEVVIKLLRPDAKNRMDREKEIMLKCAKDTDDAMYRTYLGQLDGFYRELDLSIEGKNCKDGVKYYAGKHADVDTMQVYDKIPASNTSLVVKKAEGTNMANYISELDEYTEKTLEPLYRKTEENGVTIVSKNIDASFENRQLMADAKDKLLIKIDEAVKRRDHLLNLSNVWIDQAVMKDGFYHGDLHAGNIMITDDKATFIDYGNTTQLTEKQKLGISRMVVASMGSIDEEEKINQNGIDLFYESFNDLLQDNKDEEFLKTYTDEKKQQLKAVFAKVLRKGDEGDVGKRIYVALLKAQELGVKIPPAVQGFIEGQVRLQNTINRMNESINRMKKGISKLEGSSESSMFDAVSILVTKAFRRGNVNGTISKIYKEESQSLKLEEKESFTKELLDKTYVEKDEAKGIAKVDKRGDFKNNYYNKYSLLRNLTEDEKKKMGIIPLTEEDKKNGIKTYRQMAEEFFAKHKDLKEKDKTFVKLAGKECTNWMPESLATGDSLKAFGGFNIMTSISMAAQALDWDAMEAVLRIYEEQVPQGLELVEKLDKVFEAKDPTDEELNDAYESYTKTQKYAARGSEFVTKIASDLSRPKIEMRMRDELKGMFEEKQDGLGEILRQKYEAYVAEKSKSPEGTDAYGAPIWNPLPEHKKAYRKAVNEFLDAWQAVAAVQVSRYEQMMYSKEPNVKFVNLDNVMMDVVKQNIMVKGAEGTGFLAGLAKAASLANAMALMSKLGDKATTILKSQFGL